MNTKKRIALDSWKVCFIGFLGLMASVVAKPVFALPNAMVTVDDLTAGATTTYTFSYETPIDLNTTDAFGPDAIVILTEAGGPDFSAASLDSLTGDTITGSITTSAAQNFTITLNGVGTAPIGTTVTFVVSGVVNPGSAGQGPDYTFRSVEIPALPPTIIDEVIAGSIYTSSNTPVVTNPIADQNLQERDGAQVIVADLNTVFNDADGDPMTFTVEAGHDTAVTDVAVNGDELTLMPSGGGSTAMTIRATSADGTTTDTFNVSVVGELGNPVMTPANFDAGATSDYTLTFMPDTTLASGQVIAVSSGLTGPDYSGASFVSISGGSGLTAQFFSPPGDQAFAVEILGGSASTANTMTIQIAGVVNPGSAGMGPDYELNVFQPVPLTQLALGTASGNVFQAVGEPTVTASIVDQNLNEALTETFVVSDLNTVFTDGDGDTLSFSIEAGHDTNVVTAMVNGDELTVTPVGPGVTTVTVKASDLPGGEGEVTDAFEVAVIGLMENTTLMPQGFDAGVSTTYDLNFTSSSDFGDDFVIIISNDATGGPDYSAASLASLTANGSALAASIIGQTVDNISVELSGGNALVGDAIVMSLNGVVNPAVGGTGPDYTVRLFRIFPAPSGDVEQAFVAGHDFIAGDLIFSNGFEAVFAPDVMAKALVRSLGPAPAFMPQPTYLEDHEHYVFMGHWLSRDVGSLPRTKGEVLGWFKQVLVSNQPWDDWDGDGVINIDDAHPFDRLQ